MKTQRISTQALFALKDALANIYWKKEELKRFVEMTIENSLIVATIDFLSLPKQESCSILIDRMTAKQEIYQKDLLLLIREVGNFNDFSHLEYWDKDKGGKLTKRAKEAVLKLRNQSEGYFDALENERESASIKKANQEKIKNSVYFADKLNELKNHFLTIAMNSNSQQRGFQLEKLLNELFHLFDLDAKGSFKIVGEQIDGSFSFDSQDYLLEAKWQKDPVDAAQLYTFGGKIDGKFKSTVGLFISLEGFSKESTQTGSNILRSMILMNGADLMMVLDGRIALPDLILIKRRHASDTGEIYYSFS